MDGFFSVALSIGGSLVIAGIAWGDSRRQQKITAERVVALEAERKAEADRATRDNQRINDAFGRIDALEDDVKEVRENWVTRDYLEKALDKQLERIVNSVAERRAHQR